MAAPTSAFRSAAGFVVLTTKGSSSVAPMVWRGFSDP